MTTALIYGATGYIGRLCADEAVSAGLSPVLAGRDAREVAAMGERMSLPSRVFGLDDPAAVEAGLADVDVVLNCAGPFHATAPRLIRACLATGTHYLDLAGEVPEFQQCETYHEQAVRAGVMLLPGAGFGVVPTDCLAVHVHRGLPDATHLELAFHTVGGLSRGTAATLLRDLAHEGVRRAGGELIPQRAAARRLTVDFGQGPKTAVTNPWRADLCTAGHSTGIPDIDTYAVLPGPVATLMRLAPRLPFVFDSAAWHATMNALIRRLPAGPTPEQLAEGSSYAWARASTPDGRTATATLSGPEAYDFTARAARLLLQRVSNGQATPGFQTPATAYGPDLVLDIADVRRTDIDQSTTA
ncbi:saccharopine dehydrogenase family protein [Nocardia bovistercoris]|uniref:Saccharopine dehydrogenase NADP-binding domain-containing protein n=1 Tax=Nocardia bovistercoris TaxID=2785916 RepID=A0A931N305_9NOCA|nr:saccharopine dehydrogenase NADP-binding domain-containing protein [Nocardia bovistercoris]